MAQKGQSACSELTKCHHLLDLYTASPPYLLHSPHFLLFSVLIYPITSNLLLLHLSFLLFLINLLLPTIFLLSLLGLLSNR